MDTLIGGVEIQGAKIDVYRRFTAEAPRHRVALRVKKGWYPAKWLEATSAEASILVLLVQKALAPSEPEGDETCEYSEALP